MYFFQDYTKRVENSNVPAMFCVVWLARMGETALKLEQNLRMK